MRSMEQGSQLTGETKVNLQDDVEGRVRYQLCSGSPAQPVTIATDQETGKIYRRHETDELSSISAYTNRKFTQQGRVWD